MKSLFVFVITNLPEIRLFNQDCFKALFFVGALKEEHGPGIVKRILFRAPFVASVQDRIMSCAPYRRLHEAEWK